jgi:hypothetical protein
MFKGKERKRGREALLLLLAENPLEEKPPYLLSSSLTPSRKGWLLLELIFPTFRR